MSLLIKDKNLLDTLLKLGQQATPTAPAQPSAEDAAKVQADAQTRVKDIALKFVNNLAEHADDTSTEITSEKADSKLNPKNLQDLPTFLNFLRQDGIAIGNKKIVLPHAPKSGGAMQAGADGDAEFAMMDKTSQTLYFKYPEPDDGSDNFQYYIFKDGLIKYLQELQSQAADNSPRGRLLGIYVKKLISQVNSEMNVSVGPSSSKPNPNVAPTNQSSNTAPQAGTQNVDYKNVSYVNTQGQLTPQGEVAMINIGLPLVRGQIVFSRIRRFATAYLQEPKFPNPSFAQKVIQSLDQIDQYQLPMIQLNQYTYKQIDSLIRSNTGGTRSAADILGLVEVMLTNVHLMLGQIQELFRDAGDESANANNNGLAGYKSELAEQIGNIYMENSAGIDALQNQQQQVLRDIAINSRKK